MVANKIEFTYKQLRVHLGDSCNLNCSFCHSKPLHKEYKWNPDKIVDFFNSHGFTACSFIGGETTLYIDRIVDLVNRLPFRTRNSYTTNGTTMEGDILKKTLRNNLLVSVSINEFTLDKIKYDGIRQIYRVGISCVWDGKHTLSEIDEMVSEFSKRLGYVKFPYYNLIHVTPSNSHFRYTDEQIQEYLCGTQERLEKACRAFNKNKICQYSMVLNMLNQTFCNKGFSCLRKDYLTMNADGTFAPCSYSGMKTDTLEKSKDIVSGLTKKFKCDTCIIPKDQCRVCAMSINDAECYIMREMYNIYIRTLKKYKIDYREVYDKMNRYPFWLQGGIHNGFGDSL